MINFINKNMAFFENNKVRILTVISLLLYLTGFYFSYTTLFIRLYNGVDYSVLRNILEYSVMYISLLLFCALLFKNKYLKVLSIILLFLLSINSLISVICFAVYGSSFNSGMVLSIINTNFSETVSMSTMYIMPIIISLLFFIFNIYVVKNLSKIKFNRFLIFSAIIWILSPVLL